MLQIISNHFWIWRKSKWNVVLVTLVSMFTLTQGVIKFPPNIVKQPPSDEELLFQVVTGPNEKYKPLILECAAEGEPAPRYGWYKNEKPFDWQIYDDRIRQQPGRGTLVITSPREEDIGQYQCFATNELGTATSNSVFVRKSKLNNFKHEDPTIIIVKEGEPASLQCQFPDGYPKPTVEWVFQDDRGALRSINSTRKTVDPEGTLWFSNVTKEDQFNDVAYVCIAISSFRHEYKLGSKIYLKVREMDSVTVQLRNEPKQQYVSRNNTIILRKKMLQLWCIFSGTPLPQIKWIKKNGVLLTDRVEYENYGKTLTIKHVDFEDEGTYECEATNGVGRALTYTMNVEVQAIPYFTVEPEIQNKAKEETAIFRCEASGKPEPEIRWLFNGRPIEEAPPMAKREILPNMIRIFNLSRADIGNYGCNATNDNGYVYKDVYVNVLALSPEIKVANSQVEIVDGRNVNMTCRVFGVPKPRITWFREWRELNGGRHNVTKDGDLIIQEVTFTDQGIYTCHAVNKFGEMSYRVFLNVKERTKITDPPLDCEVAAGATATFRCNAKADPKLELHIDWMINGETINFDQEPRFVKLTDNSLIITRTAELDSGLVTCIASTELDETRKSASLTVQDVPNSPRLLTIECHDRDAIITWQSMGDNRAPILGYSIQYNTSFTPDTWEDALTDLPATSMQDNVSMSPWSNYTFRIKALNKIGASLPSRHSEICTTLEDVPQRNPDNVRGKGFNPTNMVIMWSPMPEIEHNGPGFKYRVYWKRNDIKDARWSTDEVVDWKLDYYVVENQPTYKPYRIKVEAHNDIGKAQATAPEVISWSGEDVPLDSPENLALLEIESSTTACFSWLPVSSESIRGQFKGYKIQTWIEGEDQSQARNIFMKSNNESKAIISSLVPYTKNYVRILVFNGAHDGPPSNTIELDMPEGVPGPVNSLEAIPLGSSGFLLIWQKPKRPNGVLLGYRIFYQEVQGTELGPVMQRSPRIADPETTKAKLTELQPGTRYRLSVRAETKTGTGPEYFIERVTRTAGSTPPGKPKFTWQRVQTKFGRPALSITWIPNKYNAGSSFFAQYKRYGETMFKDTKLKTADDYLMIDDLDQEERYEVRVVSVDGEYDTASDVEVVEIQPYEIRARSHYSEPQNELVNKLLKQLRRDHSNFVASCFETTMTSCLSRNQPSTDDSYPDS